MTKIKLFAAFVFIVAFSLKRANAQAIYGQDVNGSPIKASRYLDINGSPYFSDSWMEGIVQLNNGQTYNLDIKYDLVADNLLFKNKTGDSLTFVLPVKEFKFKQLNHVFRSGFPSTSNNTSKQSFYEVLYDGNPALLKKQSKSIWEETTTYGTANRVKNISEKIAYYIYDGTNMKPLKNQKKSVLAAFGSKSAAIEAYIKDQKLDVSKDEDLVKVFAYYTAHL
jgi:hypothetical protein